MRYVVDFFIFEQRKRTKSGLKCCLGDWWIHVGAKNCCKWHISGVSILKSFRKCWVIKSISIACKNNVFIWLSEGGKKRNQTCQHWGLAGFTLIIHHCWIDSIACRARYNVDPLSDKCCEPVASYCWPFPFKAFKAKNFKFIFFVERIYEWITNKLLVKR